MPKPRKLQITVARPCPVSWESMSGDERVRFCALCERCVYDLSAMKLGEAQDLIQDLEGDLCVRFYERPDGTVMTSDCGFGVARAVAKVRRRALRALGAAIALALGLLGGWSLFGDAIRKSFDVSVEAIDGAAPPQDATPRRSDARRRVMGLPNFAPTNE